MCRSAKSSDHASRIGSVCTRLAGDSGALDVERDKWSGDRDRRVWFTLSHGILNEIYYPRVDNACTRDFGFIVTDGHEYFSE
jgi:hypothetical protein